MPPGPGIGFLKGPDLWVELTFATIIVVASLIIYLRTKELYELSEHKGIKYFRNTFLFFALAAQKLMIMVLNEAPKEEKPEFTSCK